MIDSANEAPRILLDDSSALHFPDHADCSSESMTLTAFRLASFGLR